MITTSYVTISEASTLKQTTQRQYITLAKRRAAFQKKEIINLIGKFLI